MRQIYLARQNERQDGHEYIRLVELSWWDVLKLAFWAELEIGASPQKADNIIIRWR